MQRMLVAIHWPSLITAVLLWMTVGFVIWNLEPQAIADLLLPGTYMAFFMLISTATYFSFFSLLEWRRSLVLSIGFTGGLWLQFLRLLSSLNILLLVLLVFAALYYLGIHDEHVQKNGRN